MLADKLRLIPFYAAFLLLLACGKSSPEGETNTITVAQSLQHDPAFWDYAASSNLLQTEISDMATEKGGTENIRNLGRRSADFHTQALERLRRLVAKNKRIQLPDSLGEADKGLVQEFMLLEGEEFDTRYRDFIVSTHLAQLDRYEEALSKADDQETRNWLMGMRAHLREELDLLAQPDSVVVAEQ
ncbi:DUF4142 domain-containing protein [Pontibacter russatus]|uniref:DUF4142 domain-containing protein n=1 Tax=Pontibacter russatus TaxID=2694929 RepID=UPI001379A8AF|nr:DUF4142 domain-containing protein [Pontibacter russatus]